MEIEKKERKKVVKKVTEVIKVMIVLLQEKILWEMMIMKFQLKKIKKLLVKVMKKKNKILYYIYIFIIL